MSNGGGQQQQGAQNVIDQAKAAGSAVYDAANDLLNDPLKAAHAASEAISDAISHSTAVKGVIDAFLVLLEPILTAFFTAVGQVRHGVATSMGQPMADILNDLLGTTFDSSVLTPPGGGSGVAQKAGVVGSAVVGQLESMLASAGRGGNSPGGSAAQTFMGFGLNLAFQNAVIALIGGCLPEVHLDELREIGDDIERSLGLSRLMRTAMHPLVNTLIAEPYRQELNVKYSPEIMAIGDLVKAWLASRLVQDDVMDTRPEAGLTRHADQGTNRAEPLAPHSGRVERAHRAGTTGRRCRSLRRCRAWHG